ncbi:MAG: Pycsar system effector family protein [Shewanella psychromarinicola]|uniref:Pycsar system effector family protein n=1 Tax=Shewanella psychromarinicola TaxID=2487742 RepID=UPI003002DBFF
MDKTIDWLKFAEAKNGAVLAVNCAILFGVLRLALSTEISNIFIIGYLVQAIIMLAASILVALLSFVPRLDAPFWVTFPSKPGEVNVLFFGHICTLSPKGYLENFYKINELSEGQFSKIDSQLSNQIVANSKIAYIKYTQFNYSIWLTISALLTPVGGLLIAKIKV